MCRNETTRARDGCRSAKNMSEGKVRAAVSDQMPEQKFDGVKMSAWRGCGCIRVAVLIIMLNVWRLIS